MKKYFFFILFSLIFFFNSCIIKNDKPVSTDSTPEIIDINSVETVLPYAEGIERIKTNCITCHSLAYIDMQPDFPRKNWEKTVDKMIKIFGAPIQDSSATKIVDYLVAVKGRK